MKEGHELRLKKDQVSIWSTDGRLLYAVDREAGLPWSDLLSSTMTDFSVIRQEQQNGTYIGVV